MTVTKKPEQTDPVEIVVSTFWPTKIIKSITLKEPGKESSYRNAVTLTAKDAKYVYQQLKALYGEAGEIER